MSAVEHLDDSLRHPSASALHRRERFEPEFTAATT
jgi:hypothetical protein